MTLRTKARLQDNAVATLAGAVADRKFSGRRNLKGAEDDRQSVVEHLSWLSESNRRIKALYSYLHIIAEETVDCYWPFIERVAGALLEHKTLSGKQIRRIIQETMPRRMAQEPGKRT